MTKSLKLSIVFSAVAGLLFLLSCVIALKTGNVKFYTITDLIGQFIFFIGLFYTINNFKSNEGEGLLSFKTGFAIGMQYTLLFAFIMAVFVVGQFAIPDFIDFLRNVSKEAYLTQKMQTQKMNELLIEFDNNYTAFKIFTMIVFRNMLTGLIFSIIISILLRSKNQK